MPGTLENSGQIIPAKHATPIVPNDAVDLPAKYRGVYVGVTGDLRVLTAGGSDVTFTALAAGIIHPIQIIRVFTTGTTATNIVGVN